MAVRCAVGLAKEFNFESQTQSEGRRGRRRVGAALVLVSPILCLVWEPHGVPWGSLVEVIHGPATPQCPSPAAEKPTTTAYVYVSRYCVGFIFVHCLHRVHLTIFDDLWVITDAKTNPRELNKFNWVGWGVDGEQAQITDVEGPLGFAHV